MYTTRTYRKNTLRFQNEVQELLAQLRIPELNDILIMFKCQDGARKWNKAERKALHVIDREIDGILTHIRDLHSQKKNPEAFVALLRGLISKDRVIARHNESEWEQKKECAEVRFSIYELLAEAKEISERIENLRQMQARSTDADRSVMLLQQLDSLETRKKEIYELCDAKRKEYRTRCKALESGIEAPETVSSDFLDQQLREINERIVEINQENT